jgi:hypothetical protein
MAAAHLISFVAPHKTHCRGAFEPSQGFFVHCVKAVTKAGRVLSNAMKISGL